MVDGKEGERIVSRPCAARTILLALLALVSPMALHGQVQIRLGDPRRADYSEVHERLRRGTPAADSVLAILALTDARRLWDLAMDAVSGKRSWNHGLIALTRLAELRAPGYAKKARQFRERLADGRVKVAPGEDPGSLVEPMLAIEAEERRGQAGDQAMLNDILARVPSGDYGLADAWLFGRLGAGAADSGVARFFGTSDPGLRVRWLTLLSFSTDTTLIPFLARVYAAPDSFAVNPRYAVRASDGLLWIGTRRSLEALERARETARARGVYASPRLGRNGLDFLGSDSASVVARTGRWIDEWLEVLR